LLLDALGGSPLVKDCLTKPNNVLYNLYGFFVW